MSISTFAPSQPSWNVNLNAVTGAGAAPVQAPDAASQTSVAAAAQAQPQTDWSTWTPKGQLEDQAYDAYAFSKFPLNVGGESFWTGGAMRRQLASWFSQIPLQRLETYGTRERFMQLPDMNPDHARLLQLAFDAAVRSTPASTPADPIAWLSQYAASGSINDFLVRGPLLIEMGLLAAQVAVTMSFPPDVPGTRQLKQYAQAAAQLTPPPAAPQP